MLKPNGYDEAQSFGEFETLPAGGYKCLIKKVVCEKTQAGKEYLKIGFDIAEGKYKDFYQKRFSNDTRENPKFKGLITSVEESNENFKFDFDEQKLVNKKVGLVFREEEFIGTDGQVHIGIKPFYAVSYNKAEETKIPRKKEISEEQIDRSFEANESEVLDALPF